VPKNSSLGRRKLEMAITSPLFIAFGKNE